MPRYTAEVMYELAKSPLSDLEATNTDLNSLKIIKRRESLLYRKSFGSNQEALRRFREEAEERKATEISIDVEDVADSDISLTEYANRYLSQKGNAGRKSNKGGDNVHPKFAIALAATQAKTSKSSSRGPSSNAFAAFADADETNVADESAVAEDDDDDGWNTVPARHQVPTHPWHRAAARKSFGVDHHRPSFNSSNKTTGVYCDPRRRSHSHTAHQRQPSLTRDDVNSYFEPKRAEPEPVGNNGRHVAWTQDEEWKRQPLQQEPEQEQEHNHDSAQEKPSRPFVVDNNQFNNPHVRYPLPLPQHPQAAFKENFVVAGTNFVSPLTPPPVDPIHQHASPIPPPIVTQDSGGFEVLPPVYNSPLEEQQQCFSALPHTFVPPVGCLPGSPHMMDSVSGPIRPHPPNGPYFAVVLPPDIVDKIHRGLLPPPPPPPPMHMMWRGGPLPPGVGIPVPVMPW